MYFKDLTSYSYYLGFEVPVVKNVGWLDDQHFFQKGKVSVDFLQRLRLLIGGTGKIDIHVNMIRSVHPCNLCGEAGIEVIGQNKQVRLGSSEIWLPSASMDYYFAAPSMVLHYIEVHGYIPPQSFVDAVMTIELNAEFIAQNIYDSLMKNYIN